MKIQKFLSNLAVVFLTLSFGLMWVGVFQFFLVKSLGHEVKIEIANKLKTTEIASSDITSVSEVSIEKNESSHPQKNILDEKFGDLDKDGIDEKVLVFQKQKGEHDFLGEIHIFKNQNNQWVTWKKSKNAIFIHNSVGSPFQHVKISNGILTIAFSGGSSWFWFSEDKYRFQNNKFELIGHTSYYGKLCNYFEEVDYNISTGKVFYEKRFEKCVNGEQIYYKTERDTFFEKQNSISLKDRYIEEMKIISPKYQRDVYLVNNLSLIE